VLTLLSPTQNWHRHHHIRYRIVSDNSEQELTLLSQTQWWHWHYYIWYRIVIDYAESKLKLLSQNQRCHWTPPPKQQEKCHWQSRSYGDFCWVRQTPRWIDTTILDSELSLAIQDQRWSCWVQLRGFINTTPNQTQKCCWQSRASVDHAEPDIQVTLTTPCQIKSCHWQAEPELTLLSQTH
jgi:hypothetical protein